ncbi:MAG: hypothetical protein ACOYD1_07670 [Candidatus Nanopelagicales bacterium]
MAYATITGDWSSQSSSAIRLVVEIDDLPAITPASASIQVTRRIHLQSRAAVNDSSTELNADDDFGDFEVDGPLVTDETLWVRNLLVTVRSFNLNYGSQREVDIWSDIDGVGGRYAEVSGDFHLPARPYQLPRPPLNPSVTKTSDTKHTVSWTKNYTDNAAGQPWFNVHVERWDNVTNGWYEIAVVSWSAASYVDTTTSANRIYQYRVASSNTTGLSTYAVTALSYTTIPAATAVTWSRPVADVTVSWVHTATAAVSTEVQYSTNGGSTWTALTTAGPGIMAAVQLAPTSTLTYLYRVRPVISGITGAWTVSAPMPPLAAPAAPTALWPAGIVVDASLGVSFTWQHNSTDGTAQQAVEIQWRLAGSPTWTTTGKVNTGAKIYPASFLTNNNSYEWQARTWGQHANPSPWSTSATVVTANSPVVTITAPSSGSTIIGMLSAVDISYYDAENSAQTRTSLVLWGLNGPVYSATFNGPATSLPVNYTVANNTTYLAVVQVMDATGLWSAEAAATFTTSFVSPAPPEVTAEWLPDQGAVMVSITNQAPGPIDPEYNRLFRDGVLIASHVELDSVYMDWIPPSSTPSTYTVEAVSVTPTLSEGATAVAVPDMDACSEWIWLNGGDGFSVVGRFRGSPDVSQTVGISKVFRQFAGRTKAVVYTGIQLDRKLSVSGRLEPTSTLSTAQRFEELNASTVVCYRDPWGRRLFGTMSNVKTDQLAYGLLDVSFTITEVDHDEVAQ